MSDKPTRRQIVFNWIGGEDLDKTDGCWGTADQVDHVDELLVALDAQAQASLAAAQATLIEICDVVVYWNHDITGGEPAPFGGNYQKKHLEKCKRCQLDSILLPITVGYTVTPSDSTALAKLLAEERRPWEESLREIMDLVESGALVRDISGDLEPGWAMKQIPLVTALAKAHDLLAARVAELKGEQK